VRLLLLRLLREEDGTETVEFALVLSMVTLGLVSAISLLGEAIAQRFQQLVAILSSSAP
jgi:Flp pilus assembly pilin Flp